MYELELVRFQKLVCGLSFSNCVSVVRAIKLGNIKEYMVRSIRSTSTTVTTSRTGEGIGCKMFLAKLKLKIPHGSLGAVELCKLS